MRKHLILGLFILLLLGVGGLVYWGQYNRRSAELYYSGTIEVSPSNLAFQVSGRVQEVLTDEGRAVEKGQVLAVLDRLEFAALRDQARANLTRAEQNLRQLETGLEVNRKVLPAEVERAEAAEQALKAQLAQQETGNRSQEIIRARLTAEATRVTLDNARKDKARYDDLFAKGVVAEKTRDAANLAFQTALKEHERAVQAYLLSKEGFRREEIDTARSRLAEGQAALRLARINLQKIEATEQEVEAARAQMASANAALNVAEIQLARTELHAPYAGIVLSRNVEPGEVVSPSQEVLSMADLSRVDLKVFVGESEIGKIKPGRPVDVKIDTFPDKTYTGRVAFISPQAEFTPKIIQTHKERVKLVYLVKVSIPNPDLELKSGMPADAWFR
ncbi:MAG TPA: efflux RND transporter periplasmic adaptor subunit [Desulfobacterales bacterium]|nr:efflux RND transporter periplasmic adaptor subunit [Desulfobacterales bacterium]